MGLHIFFEIVMNGRVHKNTYGALPDAEFSLSKRTLRRRAAASVYSFEIESSEVTEFGPCADIENEEMKNRGNTSRLIDCSSDSRTNSISTSDDDDVLEYPITSQDFVESDANNFYPLNSSKSSYSSDESITSAEEVESELRKWSIINSVPHLHINSLLGILRKYWSSLPKDARTLLRTNDKKASIKSIAGGHYHHFGLCDGLINEFKSHPASLCCDDIFIQINFDGLPLYKSSPDCFWPILGKIIEDEPKHRRTRRPFVIGIWVGKSKPTDVCAYLQEFVNETKFVMRNGLKSDGKLFNVTVKNFVCDAPAKSFVKRVKAFNGYFGCDLCEQKGSQVSNRVVFLETDARPRTDQSFKAVRQAEHHHGISPLVELEVGMVTSFPLDYMHLVCLGVMKKMLCMWMTGPLQVRLDQNSKRQISRRIDGLSHFMPREFGRKVRGLKHLDRYKASEFRNLLLYIGPLAFRPMLHKNVYNHFLMLSMSVYILCSREFLEKYGNFVKKILTEFVVYAPKLYGPEFVTYNVHGLVHLADHANLFGTLQNFSAFPYENFLGMLKKMLRKGHQPLQQVVRRISERNSISKERSDDYNTQPQCRSEHSEGPLPYSTTGNTIQYRKIEMRGFLLCEKCPDNAFLVGNDVYLLLNVISAPSFIKIVCRKFQQKKSFFLYPFHSTCVNIFLVNRLSSDRFCVDVNDVKTKVILLPYRSGAFLSIPMLE